MISEIDTFFGLIHSMCSRLIYFSTEFNILIENKKLKHQRVLESIGLRNWSVSVRNRTYRNSSDCWLMEIMVERQSSKFPTIHLVLPRLLLEKFVLKRLDSGWEIQENETESPLTNSATMKLSEIPLQILKDKVTFHPIYVASLLLHPLMATLSWVIDNTTRSSYLQLGKQYPRKGYRRESNGTAARTRK